MLKQQGVCSQGCSFVFGEKENKTSKQQYNLITPKLLEQGGLPISYQTDCWLWGLKVQILAVNVLGYCLISSWRHSLLPG